MSSAVNEPLHTDSEQGKWFAFMRSQRTKNQSKFRAPRRAASPAVSVVTAPITVPLRTTGGRHPELSGRVWSCGVCWASLKQSYCLSVGVLAFSLLN